MDATQRLIAQLLEQRERWVDLGSGKRVCFRRLAESEAAQMVGGDTIALVSRVVIKWEGFTEADLLGAGIGSSDPAPFAPELWALVVVDRVEWINKVAEAVFKEVESLLKERRDVSGNSRPSSTPTLPATNGKAKPSPKEATQT